MAVAMAAGLLTEGNSRATLFTASGTGADSQPISASADIVALGGNQLQVTLANTYSGTSYGISEVLYGVYFNGATGLSLVSATTPAGAVQWDLNAVTPNTTLATGTSLAAYWKDATFGALSGASALGGGNQMYGLVSAGFNGTITDGLGNANHNPYLQNSIVLLFSYTTLGNITDVQFTYNTTQDKVINGTPNGQPSVPEPSTIIAGALLLLPLGVSVFRIVRRPAMAKI